MASGSTSARSLVAHATAALFLAGCCCAPSRRGCDPCGGQVAGEPAGAAAAGRGVLLVSAAPAGEVWIDGVPAGPAPVEAPVSAGSHEVVVRLGGFEDSVQTVTTSGARTAVSARLVARDVEDRQVLQMLAPGKLWVRPYDAPETVRGAGDAVGGTVAVYPRGEVRASDVLEQRIDFGGKAGAGEVRYRRGEMLLASKGPDAGTTGAWIGPVPETVRVALEAGDKVTWGWYPEKGDAVEAEFQVVERDLDSKLKAIDEALAGQPKTAAAYLRITVLEDAGLPYAAHQEALRTIREGSGTMRAWAAVLSSLKKMAVPDGALAWREARSRVASFTQAEQGEAFGGAEYGTAKAIAQMREGRAGRALQSLDSERLSVLSQTGKEARRVVTAASTSARRLAERSPGSARKLADTLFAMAKSARDQAPKDPEATAAYGTAIVARARTQAALGDAPKGDAWREAATSLTAGYAEGLDDGGRSYLQAAAWLREAAAANPKERAALLKTAQEYAAKAKERFPDSGASAATGAVVLLARADADPAKDAKGDVLEALGLLTPFVAQDPVDPDVATAHSDLVSLDRRRALKSGAAYRLQDRVSSQDLAKYAVPAGSRWRASDELPAGYVVYLEQSDSEGDLVRTVSVRAVQWGDDYKFSSGAVAGGENTSLLAKHDLDEMRRTFSKVKEPGRVARQRFSKRFERADAYEVSGTDHEGGFRRTRGWVFRSEKRKVTFMVTADEFARAQADDPEWEVFRDSFTDVGGKD